MFIPSNWKAKITNIHVDSEGMSAADVIKFQYENDFLYIKSIDDKYSKTTYSVAREKSVVQWLNGQLNVPTIIDFGIENNREFMVMGKLPGIHIDDFKESPDEYVVHLANCIKLIQSIDIQNCPFDSRVDMRLAELKFLIDNNLASLDDWEDTTNFTDPHEFYRWLYENRPSEDLVFSHGDLTANFFVKNSDYYFYDMGRAGVADKWYDIAFCICIIRDFGDKKYEDKFFELLNIAPNYEKIEYFILLDEMF